MEPVDSRVFTRLSPRPWRTSHLGYTVDADDIESGVAARVLSEVTLRRQVERNLRWQGAGPGAPDGWRSVGLTSETVWWITATEAAALEGELTDLLRRFRERLVDPASRPEGARAVEVVALMHLFDAPNGTATADASATPSRETREGRL